MKILITGSSGFIGTNLVNTYIKKDFLVYGLDIKKSIKKKNFSFFKCNLLNKEKLHFIIKIIKPEIVIHLAARTDLQGKKISDYKINYDGTRNLINVCNNINTVRRVIFASTLLVNKFPYETKNYNFYDADTIYGKSKYLMEKIIKSSNVKFEWCIIRPTTIWGDGLQNHFKLFLILIKKNLYFHFGKNKIYKSYGYVKNTVFQIHKLSLTKKNFFNKNIFYLFDYTPICLNDFSDKISIFYKKKKNITLPLFIAKWISIMGDLLVFAGFKNFPLQSRRFNNLNKSFIIKSDKIKKICEKLPYDHQYALHSFLESYKINKEIKKNTVNLN
jgi:nucleoside-diphosphate-sugar epimerase